MSLRVEPIVCFTDDRGALHKLLPRAVSGEVYAVTGGPGVSRGHHRHHRMGEWFAPLSGAWVLGVTSPAGETSHVSLDAVRVYVPAGWAHALFNVGETTGQVLACADRVHDPSDVEPARVPEPPCSG